MMRKMPGQLDSLKARKSSSEVKSSRKASATRRRCVRSVKPAAESSVAVSGHSEVDWSLQRLPPSRCQRHPPAARRGGSPSPHPGGPEGKENERRTRPLDADSCRADATADKRESEDMDCQEIGKNIFPDDDSNQILPVEQFFGNLDAVQDFPQRSSAASRRGQREKRRRHYYAREDSEEEEEEVGLSSTQPGDGGGSSSEEQLLH